MASNVSYFMVTWTIFRKYLLEVGLAHNQEIMAPWTLTTVKLFYFIMCEDPRELKLLEIAFRWGPGHIWLPTTLEDPWPHYVILEVSWDSLWTFLSGSHNFMVTAFGSYVKQWSGRFFSISGWEPGVCKSNRLHVHILWFPCIKLRNIQ